MLAFAASLLILASEATGTNVAWRGVIDALATKHAPTLSQPSTLDSQPVIRIVPCVTNALETLRAVKPRYLAFVMRPEELDEPTIRALHVMVRDVDDDPFDDAIWGIVTGPTAHAAKRIAASREPVVFEGALATTGMDRSLVKGSVTILQDHTPPPEEERDSTPAFVFGWNDDPSLILTSSHATEDNLEMPFSRGEIRVTNGLFIASCGLPMREPTREKVWIAAGNCLIGNPKGKSMVMTALGWGKVNQFFGYTIETWFGEIGWNTWRYFNAYHMPLTHCWYAANQNLVRTLATAKPGTRERRGKEWDMDGTAFYGDPMQFITLTTTVQPPTSNLQPPPWTPDALPLLYVFELGVEHKPFPTDWEVFEADDFALILKW